MPARQGADGLNITGATPLAPEKKRDDSRGQRRAWGKDRDHPAPRWRTRSHSSNKPDIQNTRTPGQRGFGGPPKVNMSNKMLIDATHTEETRVVVVDGNKVEEFDFESENKRQLAGNIYLAKVTRVEPSLQAAFIDYGGNRHGFLAFSEIHPDYYQIPVADREALLAEEAELAAAEAAEDEEEKPQEAVTITRWPWPIQGQSGRGEIG